MLVCSVAITPDEGRLVCGMVNTVWPKARVSVLLRSAGALSRQSPLDAKFLDGCRPSSGADVARVSMLLRFFLCLTGLFCVVLHTFYGTLCTCHTA